MSRYFFGSRLTHTLTALFLSTVPSLVWSQSSPPEGLAYPEAPASGDVASKVQLAFGFDRLVESYTGSTALLQRQSDGDQRAFGFDANGLFDLAGVEDWAGESDVLLKSLTDQGGSARSLTVVGNVFFKRAGFVTRFGTSWDPETGQISLRGDAGAVGVRVENGAYLRLDNSGLNPNNGLEVAFLSASLQRKRSNAVDPLGMGNTVEENYFSYGVASNNTFSFGLGGGSALWNIKRVGSGAGGTSQSITTTGIGTGLIVKQNSLNVLAARMVGSEIGLYHYGRRHLSGVLGATNVTANTTFIDRSLLIGAKLDPLPAKKTLAPASAVGRANILFGGVLITNSLTDSERYLVTERLKGLSQQHLLRSKEFIMSMFDEVIRFKNVDDTGLIAGDQGKTALQLNMTQAFRNKNPSWNLRRAIPGIGISGVYTPDDANYANVFESTNNYFAGTSTGSVAVLGYRDLTGFSANYAGNLGVWLAQGTGTPFLAPPASPQKWSFSLGWDHTIPVMSNLMATDPSYVVGGRRFPLGIKYDGINQPMGKYNMNTANATMVYEETLGGTVWGPTEWKTNVGVENVTPDNLSYPINRDGLILQIGTFRAPEGYSRTLEQSEKNALALRATNWQYLAPATGSFVGHMDGSVARTAGWGSVTDSDDNAKIMTSSRLSQIKGTRVLFGFAKREFSFEEASILTANVYKLTQE